MDISKFKTLGQLLREQYDQYRGSAQRVNQSDIALEMNIDQGQLSRIQNDKDRGFAQRLLAEQVETLLRGYNVPESDFFDIAMKFDLRIPKRYFPLVGAASATSPVGRTVPVINAGTVTGGLRDDSEAKDTPEYIDTPVDFLGNADPEKCMWLEVVGDSMACADAKRAIPEGSKVLVDTTRAPSPGDVIVCELLRDGHTFNILKAYRPQRKYVTLESYNDMHPPIHFQEGDYALCKGVVIGKWDRVKI